MKSFLKYTLIPFSLFLGLLIYLGYRSTSTPFYHWAGELGFREEVDALRNLLLNTNPPTWFINSMPDGLWMFSFVLFTLAIWNFKINKESKIWIYGSIVIGLGYEVMQSFVSGYGVFDWVDFWLMMLSAFLSIVTFSNTKTNLVNGTNITKIKNHQNEIIFY